MIISPLLAVSLIMKVVAVLFVLCSIILILVILIQKGRGGGLNAALGGAMASGILGSKTGDFLTWVTIALVGIFLVVAVLMAKFYKPTVSEFGIRQTNQQKLPAESPPPVPTESNEARTTNANKAADANITGG